jgi:hypothetical protein
MTSIGKIDAQIVTIDYAPDVECCIIFQELSTNIIEEIKKNNKDGKISVIIREKFKREDGKKKLVSLTERSFDFISEEFKDLTNLIEVIIKDTLMNKNHNTIRFEYSIYNERNDNMMVNKLGIFIVQFKKFDLTKLF